MNDGQEPPGATREIVALARRLFPTCKVEFQRNDISDHYVLVFFIEPKDLTFQKPAVSL